MGDLISRDEVVIVKTTPLSAVKTVIDGAGISPYKVAKITGLAQQTVSNYYIGRTYPNLANFALICKACGVTVTIKDGEVRINATY
jgi:transcriptional regulator with XRE-family HTH domain